VLVDATSPAAGSNYSPANTGMDGGLSATRRINSPALAIELCGTFSSNFIYILRQPAKNHDKRLNGWDIGVRTGRGPLRGTQLR
jgi:hypothetical protein